MLTLTLSNFLKFLALTLSTFVFGGFTYSYFIVQLYTDSDLSLSPSPCLRLFPLSLCSLGLLPGLDLSGSLLRCTLCGILPHPCRRPRPLFGLSLGLLASLSSDLGDICFFLFLRLGPRPCPIFGLGIGAPPKKKLDRVRVGHFRQKKEA